MDNACWENGDEMFHSIQEIEVVGTGEKSRWDGAGYTGNK